MLSVASAVNELFYKGWLSMNGQFFAAAICVFSAVIALAALLSAIYIRRAPNSLYFTYLALSVFVLTFSRLFGFAATLSASAIIAVKVMDVARSFIMPLLLLFICEYSGVILEKRYTALLMSLSTVLSLLVLTWPLHSIYYKNLIFVTDALLPYVQSEGTALYIIARIYDAVMAFVSCLVLFAAISRGDSRFRKRSRIIAIAVVLMLSAAIVSKLRIGSVDLPPVLFGISCLLISYSKLNLGLYRAAPIAREQMVEAISDGYIMVDMHGHFLDANPAAKSILPQLEVISIGEKLSKTEEIAWLSKPSDERRREFSVLDAEGAFRHYQLSETNVMDASRVIGRCIMIFDITDTKQLLQEVSLLAERDALTGLYNRRTLFETGERLFKELVDRGGDASAFMVDIDFFKKINDTHGHIQGDRVLKGVASVFLSCFRTTDLIARYGGEEFFAFLPGVSERVVLENAEKLRRSTEELEFVINGTTFGVTVSIGVAIYDPMRHLAFDELVADADSALYTAKNSGRNTVYLAQPAADKNGVLTGQLNFECAVQEGK